ncbi:MAG TPA: TolC family protein [Phenylobacterium sp.]|nr:TolC family protein [Phenylobacterium sp.]
MSSNLRRPPWAGLLFLGCLGASSAALAEPAPPFKALLAEAQATAPRLAEARADIARAEGLARQAGVMPNPTLELDIENFSGSGPFRGTSLSETTATFGQTLELGGKRSARAAAGRAEVEVARAEARQAEAEYAFDLTAAYAEAEASDRRLQLALDALSLAEQDGQIASALVDAGREAELRRLQAQAAAQAARAAVDEARVARAEAFGALTALAGAPVPFTSIPVSLLDSEAPLSTASTLVATGTASYLAAQAEQEAAARRLRVERRRAIPDVTVSMGVRRFEEDDATALVAGLSAPLPLFDQNRGNIAAAGAEVTAAEARLNAARLEAEAAVRTSAARTSAAQTRITAARQGETTAQEAYRLARIGYEAGRLPLAELVAARRALAEAREQTIAAAVERISAQAAQARLSGVAIPGEQQ